MPSADDLTRLARYGISGGLSALTHFTVGLAASAWLGLPAVPASTTGFAASVAVSYLLQRAWVFRADAGHSITGPRFLTVTAAALALNTAVLWIGADLLDGPYAAVQGVAILLIPVVNYLLNSRWTFARA
ncbi:GtrA family protein [Actinoplanes sp. NEAU-A12]|uniref:GtrA family protein n=1 Tax=Actinoplanes sandaracinus TaxID=3045177 RepID=A0ABT6WD51_9ACTN|nr:GtrA family protein [Actinoplanes sandaracinus]MDI6097644.1 GtrA family protein [Actinoplanes sandaracinus]